MWTTDKESKERAWRPDKPPVLSERSLSATTNAEGRIYHVTYCLEAGTIRRFICGHDGLPPEKYCKAL